MKGIIVVAAIALVLAGGYFGTHNGLVAKDEACTAAEREIDNQLQRRYDLIPGYVEIVKKYARHEEDLFKSLAEARKAMMGASTLSEKAEGMAEMNGAFARLAAIAENYPELKSNENFLRLQDEYAGTENRIAVARHRYNEAVREYNKSARTFPGSLFKMERRDYFELPAAKKDVREAPDMKELLK